MNTSIIKTAAFAVTIILITTLSASASVIARYDASGFTSAGTISSWADSSGNNYDANTAVGDPSVTLAAQNGLAVVSLDGNDYLTTPDSYTIGSAFAVAKYSTATFSGHDGLFTGNNTGSGSAIYWSGNLNTDDLWGETSLSPRYFDGVEGSTGLDIDKFSLYSGVDSTPTSWSGYAIGADRPSVQGTGRAWDGDIAEIILFDTALSDFDRKGVEVYLDEKWGLGLGLRSSYGSGTFNVDTVALGLTTDDITLVLRLDASEFTSAGAISTWSDSSGNGYDATATGDPTVVLAEQNGLAVVRQDGDDHFIVSQEYTTGSAFIVAKFGATTFPTGSSTEGLYGANTGHGAAEMYFTGGSGVNWANEDGSQFENAKWFNGVSGHTGISDPAKFNLSTGVDVSPRSFTSWAVGADRGFGAGRAWTGDIAEVVVYEETLSAYNRKGVEVYLDEKWNLGIGLRAAYGAGNFNDNAYALHLGPPQGTMITIQ